VTKRREGRSSLVTGRATNRPSHDLGADRDEEPASALSQATTRLITRSPSSGPCAAVVHAWPRRPLIAIGEPARSLSACSLRGRSSCLRRGHRQRPGPIPVEKLKTGPRPLGPQPSQRQQTRRSKQSAATRRCRSTNTTRTNAADGQLGLTGTRCMRNWIQASPMGSALGCPVNPSAPATTLHGEQSTG
jgi:hypothetical protein